MTKLDYAALASIATAIITVGLTFYFVLAPIVERLETLTNAQAYVLRMQLLPKPKPAPVKPLARRLDI